MKSLRINRIVYQVPLNKCFIIPIITYKQVDQGSNEPVFIKHAGLQYCHQCRRPICLFNMGLDMGVFTQYKDLFLPIRTGLIVYSHVSLAAIGIWHSLLRREHYQWSHSTKENVHPSLENQKRCVKSTISTICKHCCC